MTSEQDGSVIVGRLDETAGQVLVAIARQSAETFIKHRKRYLPDLDSLPAELRQAAPSFVTLSLHGELRGCIGSVVARRPLALDVAHNAVAAATSDPRFPPLTIGELDEVRFEVTVLTVPRELVYQDYEDLVRRLRPGEDGVMLTWLGARGLLLPQVWRRLPDPHVFLEHVCLKAGIPPVELHRRPPEVQAWTFTVQTFHEPGYEELA